MISNITEGIRQFDRDGERYSVTVYYDDGTIGYPDDPNNKGWAYRVESDNRGSLDSGPIDSDDPWAEMERMFPELQTVVS